MGLHGERARPTQFLCSSFWRRALPSSRSPQPPHFGTSRLALFNPRPHSVRSPPFSGTAAHSPRLRLALRRAWRRGGRRPTPGTLRRAPPLPFLIPLASPRNPSNRAGGGGPVSLTLTPLIWTGSVPLPPFWSERLVPCGFAVD